MGAAAGLPWPPAGAEVPAGSGGPGGSGGPPTWWSRSGWLLPPRGPPVWPSLLGGPWARGTEPTSLGNPLSLGGLHGGGAPALSIWGSLPGCVGVRRVVLCRVWSLEGRRTCPRTDGCSARAPGLTRCPGAPAPAVFGGDQSALLVWAASFWLVLAKVGASQSSRCFLALSAPGPPSRPPRVPLALACAGGAVAAGVLLVRRLRDVSPARPLSQPRAGPPAAGWARAHPVGSCPRQPLPSAGCGPSCAWLGRGGGRGGGGAALGPDYVQELGPERTWGSCVPPRRGSRCRVRLTAGPCRQPACRRGRAEGCLLVGWRVLTFPERLCLQVRKDKVTRIQKETNTLRLFPHPWEAGVSFRISFSRF